VAPRFVGFSVTYEAPRLLRSDDGERAARKGVNVRVEKDVVFLGFLLEGQRALYAAAGVR